MSSYSVVAPQILTKQPWEKRYYSMDFENLMVSGETISTKVVTSEVLGGGTTDLSITSDIISGQTVEMWIESGTHAKRYRVEVRVTTSLGQKLEGDGILKVRDR